MDWRFSTFILLLLAMLLGIPWATSETGVCSSKFVLDVLKQGTKDGALNCFEFWFNRYQTLLGAAAALGAAWYAGRWVKRQIEKTDQAIALTRSQIAASILPNLESKVVIIDAAVAILEELDDFASKISWNIRSVLTANEFNNFDHPGEMRGEPYYSNCVRRIEEATILQNAMNDAYGKAREFIEDSRKTIEMPRNAAIDAQERISAFHSHMQLQVHVINMIRQAFDHKDIEYIKRNLQPISESGMYKMILSRQIGLYNSEVRAALMRAHERLEQAQSRVLAATVD